MKIFYTVYLPVKKVYLGKGDSLSPTIRDARKWSTKEKAESVAKLEIPLQFSKGEAIIKEYGWL